ncbi:MULTISPECIES: porin [Pseudoalteromonas]|uniref:porin n=1 Tax=Pseudoalteromonas TaxID=53246 RepID=UPI000FFF23BC|nr:MULTISPECIES: porin [Pseudoalteromonas]MCG9760807.1 porin [Pseudoalteromonas sp. Isolate6]NKC17338.1 porin [Pseudoalteromonas galatheae]RXE84613.1 hypothetical protein DRB05_22105 [Pseudoalteromonas sp. A757]
MTNLPLTTATVLFSSLWSVSTSAEAANHLYGLINIALEQSTPSSALEHKISSKASRFGIKGERQLEHKVIINYKIEYGVNLNGERTSLREHIVLLNTEHGNIKLGYSNTPFKLSQGKVDIFNDVVDMKLLLPGDNVTELLHYQSPTFDNWRLNIAYIANGNDQYETHATSSSLQYQNDNLYFAIAYENGVTEQELIRVSTSYNYDAWQLGYLYQAQLNNNLGNRKNSGHLISASYKLNSALFKGQYISSSYTSGNKGFYGISGVPMHSITLGLDYSLQQHTTWYSYFAYGRSDDTNQVSDNDKRTIIGMGLKTLF